MKLLHPSRKKGKKHKASSNQRGFGQSGGKGKGGKWGRGGKMKYCEDEEDEEEDEEEEEEEDDREENLCYLKFADDDPELWQLKKRRDLQKNDLWIILQVH